MFYRIMTMSPENSRKTDASLREITWQVSSLPIYPLASFQDLSNCRRMFFLPHFERPENEATYYPLS